MSDIRERSGSVNSDDKLVAFFYLLMRDHLTPGVIEDIMRMLADTAGDTTQFSNGWLAKYADDVARRLK